MSWAIVAGAAITVGGGYLASQNASDAQDNSTDIQNRQLALASDQWNTWKTNYLPAELGLLNEAQNWDSPARVEQQLGATTADVGLAYDNAKQSLAQRLQSYGVDPSSGKFASTFGRLEGQEAATLAGSKNLTRRSIAEEGFAKRYAAAGLGRGLMASGQAGLNSAAQTAAYNANTATQQAQAGAWGAGQLGAYVQRGITQWNNQQPAPAAPYQPFENIYP